MPFDPVSDYDEYVDGKPRYDGVRSFLASRGIELPQGSPSDPPDAETIDGLGNRKNELVLELIHRDGVQPYEGSVRLRARPSATPGCDARSCRRAPTAATCSRRRGSSTCSRRSSTGTSPSASTWPASPPPTRFSRRRASSASSPASAAVFEDALAGVRGGPRGELRLRRRRRSGRAGRRAQAARRRRRRPGPGRAAGGIDDPPPFVSRSSPGRSARRDLDLDALAQTESVFALSNGHIGLARQPRRRRAVRPAGHVPARASTSCDHSPTVRAATATRRRARPSSTSPTARSSGCSSRTSRSTSATESSRATSECSTCAPGILRRTLVWTSPSAPSRARQLDAPRLVHPARDRGDPLHGRAARRSDPDRRAVRARRQRVGAGRRGRSPRRRGARRRRFTRSSGTRRARGRC